MRIVGGTAKGRGIRLRRSDTVRPTSERIKATLFDVLVSVTGTSFLDLYAGSGNVGIEALSRGARCVVFVERDRALARDIEGNIHAAGLAGGYDVLAMDALRAVRFLKKRGDRFDVLFADPPYEEGIIAELVSSLDDGSLLADEGMLIVQHSIREGGMDREGLSFQIRDRRRIGDTCLSFLTL